MDDILDQALPEDEEFEGNIFWGVLTNPRKVFRHVHERDFNDHVFKLLIFSGIASYFDLDFLFRSWSCLLYTSPSPRDQRGSRMPSSA